MYERESVTELLKTKLALEDEMSTCMSILKVTVLKKWSLGERESVADKESLPLYDVDFYAIRYAKTKLIKARNDYCEVMKRCRRALSMYHAKDVPGSRDKSGRPRTYDTKSYRKLALLGKVSEGSPTEYAGLQEDDIIVEFGSLNAGTTNDHNDFIMEVKNSINRYIKVAFIRDGRLKRANLKPKLWSGDGYLGCTLVPWFSGRELGFQ